MWVLVGKEGYLGVRVKLRRGLDLGLAEVSAAQEEEAEESDLMDTPLSDTRNEF